MQVSNLDRNFSADLLKAVSIFGVVWIHGASCLGCSSIFSLYISWLFRIGVPCFIIIWAYFFEKSYSVKSKEQRKDYIKKRFLHLLGIFVFWSLLYYFVSGKQHTFSITNFVRYTFNGYAWSGQYFFIILFQLTLLFPVLRYCYGKKYLPTFIILISAIIYFAKGYFDNSIPSIVGKFGDEPFVYWIIHVFAGMALARNDIKIRISKWFLLAPLLIVAEFYLLEMFHLPHSPYVTPFVLLASVVISMIAIQYNTIQYNN
jgi:surface polysaccharide O-acyltransferase-like enzyme